MTTAGQFMITLDAVISEADAQRTRRGELVLWLTGRADLPSLGERASAARPAPDGGTEYGYTLAQARRMRRRMARALRAEAAAARHERRRRGRRWWWFGTTR